MEGPTLLDLFCGAGGCAVGYRRAGFGRIVGVDHRPQPNYPFEFVQHDALEFVLELAGYYAGMFDVVHASPPCQAHSSLSRCNSTKYVDHIPETRRLLMKTGLPYVIENVVGAPLVHPLMLCGSQFNLRTVTALHGEVWLRRHRLFESNIFLYPPSQGCRCRGKLTVPVFGHGGGGPKHSRMRGKGVAQASREVMGIDWMTRAELDQAIPPVYTEHVGKQIIRILEADTDEV